jgi:glycosyltransferase involved in cell wall biosynthesis
MIKFSILIATVPSRTNTFYPRLLGMLHKQIEGRDDVEIIGLYDNKKRSVGAKRNALLNLAQGQFLTFIDDDDRVSDDYIKSIMDTINTNPDADCIVFDCITTINDNERTVYSKYSINYEYSEVGNQWRGKPAHTMVWKADIAKKHIYASQNYGEDVDWVKRACQDIKKEVRIDKTLYFYDFNVHTTETR